MCLKTIFSVVRRWRRGFITFFIKRVLRLKMSIFVCVILLCISSGISIFFMRLSIGMIALIDVTSWLELVVAFVG